MISRPRSHENTSARDSSFAILYFNFLEVVYAYFCKIHKSRININRIFLLRECRPNFNQLTIIFIASTFFQHKSTGVCNPQPII